MSNFITRIIFVVIAVPILFALALFVPFMNHAALSAIVLVFTIGAALELHRLVEPSSGKIRTALAAILACLPPVAIYVSRLLWGGSGLVVSWLAPLSVSMLAGFFITALPMSFPRATGSIETSIARASANALYLFYPGAFSSAIIVILSAPRGSGFLLIWFTLIVFGNDSLAWLAGSTVGRHRGIFAVSPKKSLEGLIAGMAGSIIAAFLGPVLFPSIISGHWITLGIIGTVCGSAVVAGDLFESSLKRSAGVKDSGTIIPGRGGILDSYDSLLFTAPVFVALTAAFGLLA